MQSNIERAEMFSKNVIDRELSVRWPFGKSREVFYHAVVTQEVCKNVKAVTEYLVEKYTEWGWEVDVTHSEDSRGFWDNAMIHFLGGQK